MRLEKEDIIDILYGATLFGSGGGGTLQSGLDMLDLVPRERQHIELVSIETMRENEYAAMAAGLGSPISLEKNQFSSEAVHVIKGIKQIFQKEKKDIRYIFSGEQGGFNTMVPLYAAMILGMPVLDLDGNGRAVPELNTGLLPINDIPTSPVVMANKKGDIIVGYAADPLDSDACETIARHMCMAYGMSVGFSAWVMNKEQLKSATVLGQLTQAQRTGKVFRDSAVSGESLVDALRNVIPGIIEFARGTITDINIETDRGFDYGTTVVTSDDGERYTVDFKNENMIIRNACGKAVLVVPEIISLISLEEKLPLTNASSKIGQRIALIGIPAHKNWWTSDGKGYKCWEHILKMIGYSVADEAVRL